MSDELDHFLDDIYGKNVPPNAYASPEGRITKGDAKVYIADELRKARIEENKRWLKFSYNTKLPSRIWAVFQERINELNSKDTDE